MRAAHTHSPPQPMNQRYCQGPGNVFHQSFCRRGGYIKTRLTYNCAHLRLNNKKNEQNVPEWSARFFGWIFLWVKFFLHVYNIYCYTCILTPDQIKYHKIKITSTHWDCILIALITKPLQTRSFKAKSTFKADCQTWMMSLTRFGLIDILFAPMGFVDKSALLNK